MKLYEGQISNLFSDQLINIFQYRSYQLLHSHIVLEMVKTLNGGTRTAPTTLVRLLPPPCEVATPIFFHSDAFASRKCTQLDPRKTGVAIIICHASNFYIFWWNFLPNRQHYIRTLNERVLPRRRGGGRMWFKKIKLCRGWTERGHFDMEGQRRPPNFGLPLLL